MTRVIFAATVFLHDLFEHRAARMQIGVFLRIVAERDAIAECDRAVRRCFFASNHGQKRRLADAVRTDDADGVAATQQKGNIFKNSAVPIRRRQLLHIQDAFRRAGRRTK